MIIVGNGGNSFHCEKRYLNTETEVIKNVEKALQGDFSRRKKPHG
jgi:hypothetical protein